MTLFETDPAVYRIIQKERERQAENIELIASENFVSHAVRQAMASEFCNKYAEGMPQNRYYGGCSHCDELEILCRSRWLTVFDDDMGSISATYHCNVQPHSGAQANFAAYMSVLQPGDTVLGMSLDAGGHLTHSSPVNFVGKYYNSITYGTDENGFIDFEDIRNKIETEKPKLIVAGASAYPRTIDFARFREIIDECSTADYKPYFMVDMSHIAGLVATGYHPTPFGYADIITTTTHKTLRSARGGLIFCTMELKKKVDSAVFPGSQGGPLMNMIAGKAVGAFECLQPAYKAYIGDVVANTKAMCNEFIKLGYKAVTGGTDNHLFLLDFSDLSVTGLDVQRACDAKMITLNKNCVPGDKRSPKYTSGVRIGCAAETTKGKKASDFKKIARKIDDIIKREQKRV